MNQYRKYFTAGVGFSFVVVALTGIIFKFFFKNHQLEEIHGWVGLAMTIIAAIHIYQNWNSLRRHLSEAKVLSLLLPLALTCALIYLAPEEKRGPNPRAVLQKLADGTTADIAKAFGKDPGAVLAAMRADGIEASDASQPLREIGNKNGKPGEVLLPYFLK